MDTNLERRIARLESAARRWRIACLALLAGATVFVATRRGEADAKSAPKLQVQQLELVDAKGAVRARLGTEENGQAALTIFGKTEQAARAVVAVSKSGSPAVILRNDRGMGQFIASVGGSGPVMLLCNEAGDIGTSLSMKNKNGTSLLGMRLPGEKTYRAVMSVMEKGDPYVKLRGPDGEVRIKAKPELEYIERAK